MDRQQLLTDLYRAYKDARRHKRGKSYQLSFEYNLESNLLELCDDLVGRTYKPRPSTCFIIHDPKVREVFAADFRDRIVHHLYYNYTHTLFERTFIADSYSCIPGRGTHYGIERLRHHICSVSGNYHRPCHVLQIDIRGYFMSIHRPTLLRLCRETMEKMRRHLSDVPGKTWEEKLDYDFVDFLLQRIVDVNPIEGCRVIGDRTEWNILPKEKSLYYAAEGCGLPIGNLSSQLFSNVYLNTLDQYVKRTLKCRHYGRYVDDAYIVDTDRKRLRELIPRISAFLSTELGMSLHSEKVRVVDVRHGVPFLGAFLKPCRSYVSSATFRRMKRKISLLPFNNPMRVCSSVNSFLGVLSHHSSYCLRKVGIARNDMLCAMGRFSSDCLRYTTGQMGTGTSTDYILT